MSQSSSPQQGAEPRCPSCGEKLYMGGDSGLYVGFGDDALNHVIARNAALEHTAYACRQCGTIMCQTCVKERPCLECGNNTFDRFDLAGTRQSRRAGTSALAELAEQIRAEEMLKIQEKLIESFLPSPDAWARQFGVPESRAPKRRGVPLWVLAAAGAAIVLIVMFVRTVPPPASISPSPVAPADLSVMEEIVDPSTTLSFPVSEPILLQASGNDFGYDARFSPLGTYIASPGLNGRIRSWLVKTGQVFMDYECQGCRDISDVAYSPDEKYIAFADRTGGQVIVLDVQSGAQLAQMPLREPSQLEFSPDGKKLAADSMEHDVGVTVWDVQRLTQTATSGRTPLMVLENGGSLISTCLKFSPDSRLLAYVGGSGLRAVIQVRDASTGALVAKIERPCTAPRSMSFSADGRQLSFLNSSIYEIWEVDSATLSKEFRDGLDDLEDSSAIVHPAGNLLAFVRVSGQALTRDGQMVAPIEVVRFETGTVLLTLRGLGSRGTSIDFSPDGTLLVASGGEPDSRVLAVWRLGITPLPVDK